MAEPIGGALIISKLRNRLNKDTFEFIACCKSWGVFKDKEEEIKKQKKRVRVLRFYALARAALFPIRISWREAL